MLYYDFFGIVVLLIFKVLNHKLMAEAVLAKHILSRVKDDQYFGLSYNMNLYRGCQHACIYCDSRSSCYQLGNLSNIRYKKNAIELLTNELKGKKLRGTIGFGAMNDPYMPIEKEYQLTRKALTTIDRFRFPVHILTKNDMVLRDTDILTSIGEVYSAVSFTITTANNDLCKLIEPGATDTSTRFRAISKLRNQGIYTGFFVMPILPFINDTTENIEQLVKMAVDSGAQYMVPYFGLTLREGSREYYYNKLDAHFPGLKKEYIKKFGTSYECLSPDVKKLYDRFYNLANKYEIPTKIAFYKPLSNEQLKLF